MWGVKFMNKKKLMALVLSLVVSVGLFSGCGKKEATSTPTSSDGTTDVAKLEPYKIKWYTIGTPQKDTAEVLTEVNKYLKKKINATVEMTQFDWGDYETKMNVKINSGEKFDLTFTNGATYKLNAKKEHLLR